MADELDLALQGDDVEHGHTAGGEIRFLQLDPARYPGGIAIWGALPAVYDTSVCPPDEGVHVHARMKPGGTKAVDETFDLVEVTYGDGVFVIDGPSAAHYNIGAILKRRLTYLRCPTCHHVHSDRGWHAVHYHSEHTCERCGAVFADTVPGISNPLMLLKELCGDVLQERAVVDPVDRRIPVHQARFPGGVQLWGSNPAIIWTSPKLEEGGIHFHGFNQRTLQPTVDETFGRLDIDGVAVAPQDLRYLMAQQALPYLVPHLTALSCPSCSTPHFDIGDMAVDPHEQHECVRCHVTFSSIMPVVSNPTIGLLPGFYHVFHELYPDVTLAPRFPWEQTTNEG